MATLNVSFVFLADAESFSPTLAGATTAQWQSADGDPASGCLQFRLTGKNQNPGNSYYERTLTFEAMGVPAGSTITAISAASIRSKCSEFVTGASLTGSQGASLTPSGYGAIEIAPAREYTATSAWNTDNGAGASGLSIPSNTSCAVRWTAALRTGNSTSAAVTVRGDTIVFTITYTPPVTQVYNDLAVSYAANVYVASDLAVSYQAMMTAVSADLAAAYASKVFVNADVEISYAQDSDSILEVVGWASGANNGFEPTVQVTLPASIQSGDQIVIFVGSAEGSSSWAWTTCDGVGYSPDSNLNCSAGFVDVRWNFWKKTAVGNEGGTTLVFSFEDESQSWPVNGSVICVVLRGATALVIPTLPAGTYEDYNLFNPTYMIAPSVDITQIPALFVTVYGTDGGESAGNITTDPAQTEVVEQPGSGMEGSARFMLSYEARGATGVTGSRTANAVVGQSARIAASFWAYGSGGGTTQVYNDLAASYSANAFVAQDVAVNYAAGAFVSQDLPASYLTTAAVASDLAAAFDTVAYVSADLAASYDTSALVAQDLAASFSVGAYVASDLAVSYLATIAVSADLAASYAALAFIAADLAASYTTAELVAGDLEASYDAGTFVLADLAASYDAGAWVNSDLAAAYDAGAFVAGDLEGAFNARAWVNADLAAAFTTDALVSADLEASYDTQAGTSLVSNDLGVAYAVGGYVNSDLAVSYLATEAVSQDLAVNYAAQVYVAADLAASFASHAFVAADVPAEYATSGYVASDLEGSYAALVAVSADLAGGYETREYVARDLPCEFATQGFVVSDLAVSWDLDSGITQVSSDLGVNYGTWAVVPSDLFVEYQAGDTRTIGGSGKYRAERDDYAERVRQRWDEHERRKKAERDAKREPPPAEKPKPAAPEPRPAAEPPPALPLAEILGRLRPKEPPQPEPPPAVAPVAAPAPAQPEIKAAAAKPPFDPLAIILMIDEVIDAADEADERDEAA